MASTPARGQARNKPRSSAVIALLLLARELLGHRLGRKLRGPGTLSPDPRECSSYIADLNPRTPGRVYSAPSSGGLECKNGVASTRAVCTFKIVLGPKNRTCLQPA